MHFGKYILGVRSPTSNNFVYGELCRYPLRIRRIERVIKYWFKVVKCTHTTYVKHIYNVMLQELNMYPSRKYVKTVLENLGFYNVWLNPGVENLFLKMFKQRMRDNYLQDWNSDIENSSRARTYRLF